MTNNVLNTEKIWKRQEAESFQSSEHASLRCGDAISLGWALIFKAYWSKKPRTALVDQQKQQFPVDLKASFIERNKRKMTQNHNPRIITLFKSHKAQPVICKIHAYFNNDRAMNTNFEK